MGMRVVPSERLRHELDALIGDAGELADPIEEIGRLGARLIIQQALRARAAQGRAARLVHPGAPHRRLLRRSAGDVPADPDRGCASTAEPTRRHHRGGTVRGLR